MIFHRSEQVVRWLLLCAPLLGVASNHSQGNCSLRQLFSCTESRFFGVREPMDRRCYGLT
jgi:hypothetical protein